MELFGQVAALLVMAGIVWEVGRYTAKLVEHGQYTWLLKIPVWPSWVVSTALLAFCLPVQALVVAGVFRDFRRGRPLAGSESEIPDMVEETRR